jgi:hypothetical protein
VRDVEDDEAEEDAEQRDDDAAGLCCRDPAVCVCARDGIGCHVEGRHYCQCSAAACGNEHGLYLFDEWRVRQHALSVLYPADAGAAGEEEAEDGVSGSPSLSPSAGLSSSDRANGSPSASFLAFRSQSFSFASRANPLQSMQFMPAALRMLSVRRGSRASPPPSPLRSHRHAAVVSAGSSSSSSPSRSQQL